MEQRKKVSIIIDGVQYDRVKPKFDISCDECDLEFLCEDIESKMPWACMALSEMDDIGYIGKKK